MSTTALSRRSGRFGVALTLVAGTAIGYMLLFSTAARADYYNYYCQSVVENPDQWCTDGSYRWYYANYARVSPGWLGGQVGIRFIRGSDGAILYRYFNDLEVYSGIRDVGYRRADAANSFKSATSVYGRGTVQDPPPQFTRSRGVRKPPSARGIAAMEAAQRWFSVLRRPWRVSDWLPEKVVRSPFAGRFAYGTAGRLARRTRSHGSAARASSASTGDGTSTSLYLVPTNTGMCLLEESGAGSCAPMADAVAGRLVVTSDHLPGFDPATIRIYGLAAPGAESVSLRLADGTTRVEKPVNGVYVFYVPGTVPDTISWRTSADGAGSVDVPFDPQ